jgi:hypothetical protein
MDLRRQDRTVKLASLAFRQARRQSERMLDAVLLHVQTQTPRIVAALRVQAKIWRERTSRAAARLRAAPATRTVEGWYARGSAWVREGPLAPLAKTVGELASRLRGNEAAGRGRYRIEVATPLSRHLALAGVGLVALLVALPAFAGRDLLNDLIFVLTMLALAQYWNLLAGYAGLVSVGSRPSWASAAICCSR